MPTAWSPSSPNRVIRADNLEILPGLPAGAFTLIYLDPPFNTGRKQNRRTTTSVRVVQAGESSSETGAVPIPPIGVTGTSPRAGGLAATGPVSEGDLLAGSTRTDVVVRRFCLRPVLKGGSR